jgi:hypothetical protein
MTLSLPHNRISSYESIVTSSVFYRQSLPSGSNML